MLRAVLLAFAAILIVGCTPPSPVPYCPPVVHADIPTKAWLRKQTMPQPVLNWLDRIGKQQAAIEANCE
jgi:hypothetical protein